MIYMRKRGKDITVKLMNEEQFKQTKIRKKKLTTYTQGYPQYVDNGKAY